MLIFSVKDMFKIGSHRKLITTSVSTNDVERCVDKIKKSKKKHLVMMVSWLSMPSWVVCSCMSSCASYLILWSGVHLYRMILGMVLLYHC